ncbi:serine hydrolase domain-containing protein [Massilia cavernae]|uniref:Class A beta-lactamase-related serine hydrolase n=1 Tax=Massilia cavernae TaxID=2320864 RepID=A0A418XXS8_9BURK|nr:serine hydrolase domain-containing protein [Massilia cavernae]RJG17745.1 class A beta-lactamase-related serine hydrolase [Massilia cavernae]
MMRQAVLSLSLAMLAACAPTVQQEERDGAREELSDLPAATIADAALDALVARHLGAGFSGVVLLRGGNSNAATARAYGLRNIERRLPVETGTRFQVGAISKWITAVAVLRLVDQGKLDLDARVGAYLPELPEHIAYKVTLRHLLSNTSGVAGGAMDEYEKDKAVAELKLTYLDASLRFTAGEPRFAPGRGWEYSPAGWVVVAAVIERVTGTSFAQAIDRLVLRPAGAHSTGVPAMPLDKIPGTGMAYAAGTRQVKMPTHLAYAAASGTIYSTAADLGRIAETVYETDLLSEESREELSSIEVAEQDYALGGRVKTLELGGLPRTVAWESGATGGFKSLLAWVPGEGKSVIILNNTDMPQEEQARAAEALLRTLYQAGFAPSSAIPR